MKLKNTEFPEIKNDSNFRVVEIFRTVEGEGRWVGLPITFIRLEGCNLRCEWCDTPYSYNGFSYKEYPLNELFKIVEGFGLKRVCITGGEPFYSRNLPLLIKKFLDNSYKVFVETNGTLWLPEIKNIFNDNLYITCSPKPPLYYVNPELIPFISELKFVVDKNLTIENIINPALDKLLKNDVIVLQPESNLPERVEKALNLQDELLKKGIESRIIPQCHKVLGLP